MKDEESRISKSNNRFRGYKNGGRESEGSARLANTKVCQVYPKVFGIGKLLPPVYFKDFASIARLLYDSVKKEQKWEWTGKQKKAFGELKKKFTKELVLAVLDLDKKMRIEVDTLDYATGGMLSIEYEDGK